MDKDLQEILAEINRRKGVEGVESPPVVVEQQAVMVQEEPAKTVDSTIAAPVAMGGVGDAIIGVKQKIVQKAVDIIHDEKVISKHSEHIAHISDRALEVEAEKQRLIVEQVNADNKVVEQEIRNRLIVLKAEAKRLKIEQKQLDKDQKAEHKKRSKDAKWEMYGDILKKLKYDYVPNAFVLSILLFFDGVKGFFDGLGAVSTAMVKAFKWVLIGGAVIATLMIIPVTREWLLGLLQFK